MTLELLICTIGDGIGKLESSLLPPHEEVRYLISWQYIGRKPAIPTWLQERSDVRVIQLEGHGLSRNRNYALAHASGDILKICDDDEAWEQAYFDKILEIYRLHPDYDIVHFQAIGPRKAYPPHFVSSWEMTLRHSSLGNLSFDERFGLGSAQLCAGEEEVFLCDARKAKLSIHYEPFPICRTDPETTGTHWQSPVMQRSKGATLYYTKGLGYACLKSVRESLSLMMKKGANPLPIFKNMIWGINYIRTWHQ